MSNRGLNSETTNLCVWRKDSRAGFYSRVLIFCLSSRIHTHTNHCNVSSLIRLCYDTDFHTSVQLHPSLKTHTHHLLTLTYHVISSLKPKAEQDWEVRCLIALIHVYNGCGRKYVSFLKKRNTSDTHFPETMDI